MTQPIGSMTRKRKRSVMLTHGRMMISVWDYLAKGISVSLTAARITRQRDSIRECNIIFRETRWRNRAEYEWDPYDPANR